VIDNTTTNPDDKLSRSLNGRDQCLLGFISNDVFQFRKRSTFSLLLRSPFKAKIHLSIKYFGKPAGADCCYCYFFYFIYLFFFLGGG